MSIRPPSSATRRTRSGKDGTVEEIPAPPFRSADGTPLEHVTLAEVADAYLYVGRVASLTAVPPSPDDEARCARSAR
jgi:hypothetical protein